MDFEYSDEVKKLSAPSVLMDEHIYPNEGRFEEDLAAAANRWQAPSVVEKLKPNAKAAHLWNLFLPHFESGAELTNLRIRTPCRDRGPRRLRLESVQLFGA